jgi:hypothetical protein
MPSSASGPRAGPVSAPPGRSACSSRARESGSALSAAPRDMRPACATPGGRAASTASRKSSASRPRSSAVVCCATASPATPPIPSARPAPIRPARAATAQRAPAPNSSETAAQGCTGRLPGTSARSAGCPEAQPPSTSAARPATSAASRCARTAPAPSVILLRGSARAFNPVAMLPCRAQPRGPCKGRCSRGWARAALWRPAHPRHACGRRMGRVFAASRDLVMP